MIWKTGLSYNRKGEKIKMEAIKISPKQAAALELFLAGKSMREISLTLSVSYSRVISLLNELLVKTGLKTRKELLLQGKDFTFEVE
jgi:DNA-binding CsgD family transcriptional regulator